MVYLENCVPLFAVSVYLSVAAGVMGVHSAFLSLVTLTFDLDIQTRLSKQPNMSPCEFGANPFSVSHSISYTNKKVTDSAKNRILCSLLRAVKIILH